MQLKKQVVGGGFLVEDLEHDDVVTPEDFTDEQRMFAETAKDFLENEVLPKDEQIESLDYELTVELLRKAGEVGLLGADIPEAYGGLELDKVSSSVIAEVLSKASSLSLTMGAHTGIGTLPIVFFGTKKQKEKYLPDLATGAKIAAYCLTEPSSGSDSLGAKASAALSDDGEHYVLNGTKQFITNAAFADIFIVYAKIEGEGFSTFIVEKEYEGVSIGPEEKKMGIKGSSTCPLILEGVKVPKENLLGEAGRGHVIAFNILNIGRYKLGIGCLGAAKESISLSAKYANERKQFGKSISSFPLVGKKLAEMNMATYVLESMVYRTAGLIEQGLQGLDQDAEDAGLQYAKGISEYALECSINKVFGSEVLDFVADEGVQIHGGYGFIQEYKIERIYRDSRINRIFEGTNEINRLLIPATLMRKALKGQLPIIQQAQALQGELMQMMPGQTFEGVLGEEEHLLQMAKKIFLMCSGLAVQKYQEKLEQEQEVVSHLSDIVIQIFALESALLRTKKRVEKLGEERNQLAVCMTKVYSHEAMDRLDGFAKEILTHIESGDVLRTQLSMLKKLTRKSSLPTIELKRHIAAKVIEAEKYVV
ncbi:acyl-CoA dehydrogenase family protein [Bacillus horti]|uniref:Alkylation response protein AidB-like acyl-CoA dehydrogenase n=1 Tax=Caldalkalibacillus horti TaxID=77523 RepID=A0ABT9VTY3_9BACI|nr:acyl-CoA dehydrogenase family protein [Bacillus horti]MDQ0164446.1 alkylation response protein AidB-like acyl-CoA dehydrogenase [Bacillus horti]